MCSITLKIWGQALSEREDAWTDHACCIGGTEFQLDESVTDLLVSAIDEFEHVGRVGARCRDRPSGIAKHLIAFANVVDNERYLGVGPGRFDDPGQISAVALDFPTDNRRWSAGCDHCFDQMSRIGLKKLEI